MADVLVVSEDPVFIRTAWQQLEPLGVRVAGCMGPLHSRCSLEDRGFCPLANDSAVALVDSPNTGVFTRRIKAISASAYAEDLQEAHPQCAVVLCGGPSEGSAVTRSSSRMSALSVLRELAQIL